MATGIGQGFQIRDAHGFGDLRRVQVFLVPQKHRKCVAPEGGKVTLTVSSTCPVTAAGPASWVQPRVEGSVLTLDVAANSGARRSTVVDLGGRTLSLAQAAPGQWPPPCVAARGIVGTEVDTGRPAVAGSLVSIYGANLALQPATATTAVPPLSSRAR